MFVLGIQGSPRKNGNSDQLLTAFLNSCQDLGARTEVIRPQDLDIRPCQELIVCEKKGFCPIRDQMEAWGYEKLRQADAVVLASPVFFYGISAQAKTFIDRCQMFWGRKYKLKLKDPDRFFRQGFLLSVAASAGKRLFEGVELTARYFFDAISADYAGSLTYRQVEAAGEVMDKEELGREIREAVAHLLSPLTRLPKVLFVSPGGGCRSPMAAALLKEETRGRIWALAAGLNGQGRPDQETVAALAARGMDVKYMRSLGLGRLGDEGWQQPDQVVFLGTPEELKAAAAVLPGSAELWEVPAPGAPEAFDQAVNEIRSRVLALAERFQQKD